MTLKEQAIYSNKNSRESNRPKALGFMTWNKIRE